MKVLTFLKFHLMISVSTKMPYQDVREISPRPGKSQGKVREDESREKVATPVSVQYGSARQYG